MKKFKNIVLLGFLNKDGHIMLNKRLDADEEMWELVGGGAEEGETAIDAIIREIQEELQYNINVEKDELRFIHTFTFENEKFAADVHYFTAQFPGLENFADSDEVHVEDLRLYPAHEALNLTLLPMTRTILEK